LKNITPANSLVATSPQRTNTKATKYTPVTVGTSVASPAPERCHSVITVITTTTSTGITNVYARAKDLSTNPPKLTMLHKHSWMNISAALVSTAALAHSEGFFYYSLYTCLILLNCYLAFRKWL